MGTLRCQIHACATVGPQRSKHIDNSQDPKLHWQTLLKHCYIPYVTEEDVFGNEQTFWFCLLRIALSLQFSKCLHLCGNLVLSVPYFCSSSCKVQYWSAAIHDKQRLSFWLNCSTTESTSLDHRPWITLRLYDSLHSNYSKHLLERVIHMQIYKIWGRKCTCW